MPIAYAQSTAIDAGSVSSGSLTFPSNNTSNGLITVGLRYGSTTFTVTSLSDTNGNSYAQIFNLTASSGDHTSLLYYAQGIAAGANTVSVVFSSAATLRWAIHEYTGLLSSGALDKFASTTGSNTEPTSPTVTDAGTNQLLFGWGTALSSNHTIVAGVNYTLRETVLNKMFSEDRIVAATGSFNAPSSMSVTDGWSMGIATFLSTSAAVAGTSQGTLIYRCRLRTY